MSVAGSDCPTGKEQLTRLGARGRRGQHRAAGRRAIKAYRCLLCGTWHVGHTDRGKRRERA